jgi:hypothetical protein
MCPGAELFSQQNALFFDITILLIMHFGVEIDFDKLFTRRNLRKGFLVLKYFETTVVFDDYSKETISFLSVRIKQLVSCTDL